MEFNFGTHHPLQFDVLAFESRLLHDMVPQISCPWSHYSLLTWEQESALWVPRHPVFLDAYFCIKKEALLGFGSNLARGSGSGQANAGHPSCSGRARRAGTTLGSSPGQAQVHSQTLKSGGSGSGSGSPSSRRSRSRSASYTNYSVAATHGSASGSAAGSTGKTRRRMNSSSMAYG